jgi:DNA-binding CsgD family transcriptional regulator
MSAVGADAALWTKHDQAAGAWPVRIVSHPGRLLDGKSFRRGGMLALALEPGRLHICVSLNRSGPDFTPADVNLLTQLRPLLTRRVMRLSAEAGLAGGAPEWDGLTGRQRQVLSLVAGGLTDAAIGRRLGCSPRTVDKHLEHVYRLLGVSCRTAAIAACGAGGRAD